MFTRSNIRVLAAGICGLMSLLAPIAHADITTSVAEVRGDVIYVKGSGAGRKQEILWNNVLVTTANPKGKFSFEVGLHSGCLPDDCSGILTTMEPDDSLGVTVAYQSSEPPSEPPEELTLKYWEQDSHVGDAVRAVGFIADFVEEEMKVTRVVSGGADDHLRYWNLTPDPPYLPYPMVEQHYAQHLPNIPYDLDVTADGSIVVTGEGGWNGHAGSDTLRIWDASGEALTQIQADQAPIGFVYSVAISPKKDWIAASGFYGDILMYHLTSDPSDLGLYSTTATKKKRTTALDISPDGSLVASASSGGIQLRSFPQGDCTSESCVLELLLTLNHSGSWVFRIAFWPQSTPEETKIVSGTDSGTIKIWTITYPDPDTTIPTVIVDSVDSDAVYSLDWSKDGTKIVTGGNGHITVYDSTDLTNILFRNEDAHAGRVNDVAFSPDNSRIVSGGADGDLKVWIFP